MTKALLFADDPTVKHGYVFALTVTRPDEVKTFWAHKLDNTQTTSIVHMEANGQQARRLAKQANRLEHVIRRLPTMSGIPTDGQLYQTHRIGNRTTLVHFRVDARRIDKQVPFDY